jgi:hypothetical protein
VVGSSKSAYLVSMKPCVQTPEPPKKKKNRKEKTGAVPHPGTFCQTSCFTNHPCVTVHLHLGTAAKGPQLGLS